MCVCVRFHHITQAHCSAVRCSQSAGCDFSSHCRANSVRCSQILTACRFIAQFCAAAVSRKLPKLDLRQIQDLRCRQTSVLYLMALTKFSGYGQKSRRFLFKKEFCENLLSLATEAAKEGKANQYIGQDSLDAATSLPASLLWNFFLKQWRSFKYGDAFTSDVLCAGYQPKGFPIKSKVTGWKCIINECWWWLIREPDDRPPKQESWSLWWTLYTSALTTKYLFAAGIGSSRGLQPKCG